MKPQALQTAISRKRGRRLRAALCPVLLAAVAVACGTGAGRAEDRIQRLPPSLQSLARGSVETVHFANRKYPPVRLVRGSGAAPQRPVHREVVSFGNGTAQRVTIVRGIAGPVQPVVRQAALGPANRIERVSFGNPAQPGVTVVRGGAGLRDLFTVDLFGPANAGELDRIAFAVHGVESRHGADPRMWRPELAGPQGPMQVSAAAALDVGGGNRFNLVENRLLGRAYLARMFRRYGNWPDALAAYNWGPANVDQWIAGGRKDERLPLETTRYIERVLRDALVTAAARL